MRRATAILSAKDWHDREAAAMVTLDFDDRFRRRIKLTDDEGLDFLLDLPEASHLRDGDGLQLEDGDILMVRAADESVLDIQCGSARNLSRIAWHLGNRHTPVQVLDNGSLRIRHDHVLKEMAEGLGADVQEKSAPFDPEPGAYAGEGHGHSHSRHHDHGDAHEH